MLTAFGRHPDDGRMVHNIRAGSRERLGLDEASDRVGTRSSYQDLAGAPAHGPGVRPGAATMFVVLQSPNHPPFHGETERRPRRLRYVRADGLGRQLMMVATSCRGRRAHGRSCGSVAGREPLLVAPRIGSSTFPLVGWGALSTPQAVHFASTCWRPATRRRRLACTCSPVTRCRHRCRATARGLRRSRRGDWPGPVGRAVVHRRGHRVQQILAACTGCCSSTAASARHCGCTNVSTPAFEGLVLAPA